MRFTIFKAIVCLADCNALYIMFYFYIAWSVTFPSLGMSRLLKLGCIAIATFDRLFAAKTFAEKKHKEF